MEETSRSATLTIRPSVTEPGELPAIGRSYKRHAVTLGYGFATLAIVVGWLGREERYIRPDIELGYWLGIIGASMMALLLPHLNLLARGLCPAKVLWGLEEPCMTA